MWGSSFTDFAKKAQEQASSLSHQTSGLSGGLGGGLGGGLSLFNLDSMQAEKDGKNKKEPTDFRKLDAPIPSTPQHNPVPLDRLMPTAASKKADTPKDSEKPSPLVVPVPVLKTPISHMSRSFADEEVEEPQKIKQEEQTDEKDGWGSEDFQDWDDDEPKSAPEKVTDMASMLSDAEQPAEAIPSSNEKKEEKTEGETNHEVKTPDFQEQDTVAKAEDQKRLDPPEPAEANAHASEEASDEKPIADHEETQEQTQDSSKDETTGDEKEDEATGDGEKDYSGRDSGPEVDSSAPPIVTHSNLVENSGEVSEESESQPAESSDSAAQIPSDEVEPPPEDEATPEAQQSDSYNLASDGTPVEKEEHEGIIQTKLEETQRGSTEAIPQDKPQAPTVSDHVLEQFSQQLKRLEMNFETEKEELHKRHESDLVEVRNDCEILRRQAEEQLRLQIRELEEQLDDVYRSNEGYKLKIDMLQRELEGTQKIVKDRESDIGKASAVHNRDVQLLDGRLKESDKALTEAKEEIKELKKQLEAAKNELGSSNESYGELKARVRTIAGELKERRGDCRDLNEKLDEMTFQNERLQTQVANMQSQLSVHEQNEFDKDEELRTLHSKLEATESALKAAETAIKEKDEDGEKTLASYKKKAQNSLAVSNSRIASAVQAKEEAELEARAARSTADAAMSKVAAAELSAREAKAEAKSKIEAMEAENIRYKTEADESKAALINEQDRSKQLQQELSTSRSAVEELTRDLEQTKIKLEAEKERGAELRRLNSQADERSNNLVAEVDKLREELQQAKESGDQQPETPTDGTGYSLNGAGSAFSADDGMKAESTIVMLQQELHDANDAIRELKETLRATIEKSNGNSIGADTSSAFFSEASGAESHMSHAHTPRSDPGVANGGNDATPLFYAIEKQAELNAARDEIARLANRLSDEVAAKVEAQDEAQENRRKMEDAESRLKRYEKLGSAAGRSAKSRAAGSHLGQPVEPSAMQRASGEEAAGGQAVSEDSGSVNLEYLKNIMLSFLNAKTVAERKTLVPVVGAVLCLTPEEVAVATKNVEESRGVESVSSALMGSLGSFM